MDWNFFWTMLTTTLGSAAVVASLAIVLFISEKKSGFHQKHKVAYKIILAVFFGLLSIYATLSAVEVNNALCNCRNLAPLFAGMVGGPVAGIGAALIGGLFRYFVIGGASALPCMLACFLAGIIGTFIYVVFKEKIRFNLLTGAVASLVTEGAHMLILICCGQIDLASKIALPIILANEFGMFCCLYVYKHFCNSQNNTEAVEQKAEEKAEAKVE